ncbi:MAG: hypothetical protein HYW86_01720 [Candidatus Roizmanbacteria bacterium]|nr:MAG: hypothetical protein HYW86_01720 [Candidatus Roizmanbacteria bacterium]
MHNGFRIFFVFLLLIFSYHLIRDLFQIFNIYNPLTDILHRPHLWCKPYCNYVTIPPEIFGIIASIIILKRNKIGLLGVILIITLPFWPLATFIQ